MNKNGREMQETRRERAEMSGGERLISSRNKIGVRASETPGLFISQQFISPVIFLC